MKEGDLVTLQHPHDGNVWEVARIERAHPILRWYWLEWIAGKRANDRPERQIRVLYDSLVPLNPLEALAMAAT